MNQLYKTRDTNQSMGYLWQMFENFTDGRRVWINEEQMEFIRDKLEQPELVDLLYDKDSPKKLGPYFKLLLEKEIVRSVGFAKTFEWSINAVAMKQWREKTGKARDITSTWWHYQCVMEDVKPKDQPKAPASWKDGKTRDAVFIAQLVAT